MLSIGLAKFIIVLTPKLDTTAENTHMNITTYSYFNFPLVRSSKYCPAAEASPIAVVRHARATISPRSTLPPFPNNAPVILTTRSV